MQVRRDSLRNRFLVVAGLALLGAGTALAIDYTWTGSSGTQFGTAANWTPGGGPPAAADKAVFYPAALPGSAHTVNFNYSPTTTTLYMDRDRLLFDLGGNTYTVTSTGPLFVSYYQTTEFTVTNGTMALNAASSLGVLLSNTAGVSSTMIVDGAGGGKIAGATSRPYFTVGYYGPGRLEIRGGSTDIATPVVYAGSGFVVGYAQGADGTLVVDASTLRKDNGQMFVGGSGKGQLEIRNGSKVQIDSGGSSYLQVGSNVYGSGYSANAQGTVLLRDAGSSLTLGSDIGLGWYTFDTTRRGVGVLDVGTGTTVTCSTIKLSPTGTLTVNGTATSYVENSGLIQGAGTIKNGYSFINTGTISPGNSVGTLTLENCRYTQNSGGKLYMELINTASYDKLVATLGNSGWYIFNGGTVEVTSLPGAVLNVGDTFDLFMAPYAITFNTMPTPVFTVGRYTLDGVLSSASAGKALRLTLTAAFVVPEPASLGLLAAAGLLLAGRRRG